MRKIHCYTDSLLEIYKKEFIRDTKKFFRASKLTVEHLGVPFTIKNEKFEIVGQQDAKELVCRNLEDGTLWNIDRVKVQFAILGDTNGFVGNGRRLKPLSEVTA